jgi:hypothetical protein
MNLSEVKEDGAQVKLTSDELVILANALNEICNGLDIAEFATRIGAERSEALRLLKAIQSAHDQVAKKTITR